MSNGASDMALSNSSTHPFWLMVVLNVKVHSLSVKSKKSFPPPRVVARVVNNITSVDEATGHRVNTVGLWDWRKPALMIGVLRSQNDFVHRVDVVAVDGLGRRLVVEYIGLSSRAEVLGSALKCTAPDIGVVLPSIAEVHIVGGPGL